MLFSWLDLHYGFGGRKTIEIKGPSCHNVSEIGTRLITIDMNPNHLAEAVFTKFFHWSYSVSLFFISYSLEGSHYNQPTCKDGVSVSIIWIRLHPHLLVYSVIYLYHFGHTKNAFYTLGYNPMLTILFCCSNCSRFGNCKLFQSALMSPWHTYITFFFFLRTTLFSCPARWFRLILYISCPGNQNNVMGWPWEEVGVSFP